VNPNTSHIAARCVQIRTQVEAANAAYNKELSAIASLVGADPGAEVMRQVFKPLAQTCDLLVFRALPDGAIPAGVAKEIQWAEEVNVPVIELPSALSRRTLTLAQTKQYLKEVGQR
jgi:hypothetical protein